MGLMVDGCVLLASRLSFPILTVVTCLGYVRDCFVTLLERFGDPTITDTITVSEQPHVTSSLSLFVNAKLVESCFEKRVRLVQFLGELLEFKLN